MGPSKIQVTRDWYHDFKKKYKRTIKLTTYDKNGKPNKTITVSE